MKSVLVTMLLFMAVSIIRAQVSVYDCNNIDPMVTQQQIEANSAEFHKQCILFAGQNYSFTGDLNKTVTAEETINFQDGFSAGTFNINGKMHFKIDKEDLDIVAYTSDLNSVLKNDKFELGIKLPETIGQKIADFISNGQSSTNINPYDPEQIDIRADFSTLYQGQWSSPMQSFGFYYEEFARNTSGGWDPVPISGYNFRIRFCPRSIGLWKCKINIFIQGQLAFEANEFQFYTISSSVKDFLRVGDNKRFLRVGENPFFPVGMNLPSQGNQSNVYSDVVIPSNIYEPYYSVLDEYESLGGNYFRYILSPWNSEIEFEALGNYTNRLSGAWEFDQLLNYLKTKDLRMHFNLSIHAPITQPNTEYGNWHWDWSSKDDPEYDHCPWWLGNDLGYCYNSDINYGVDSPIEFLTDPDSKRYYKNRLRYIISRWGYSSSIGVIELMSEINNIGMGRPLVVLTDNTGMLYCGMDNGTDNRPYLIETDVPEKVYQWQHEMATYIKQELKHINHPLAVNYTGVPHWDSYTYNPLDEVIPGSIIGNGDHSYFSSSVDVISYNHYGLSVDKYINEQEICYSKEMSTYKFQKPLIYSEIGIANCDNDLSWYEDVLMSPFTGSCGSGMPWYYINNGDEYSNTTQRQKAWAVLRFVKNFFEGIKLDQGPWTPGYAKRNDNKAQLLYLKSQGDYKRVVGVVDNMTVNYYTNSWIEGSFCADTTGISATQSYPQHVIHSSGNDALKVMDNMGILRKHIIEWYNPFGPNANLPFEIQIQKTDLFGNLKIKHPKLESNVNKSIYYFRAYPEGHLFQQQSIDDEYDVIRTLTETPAIRETKEAPDSLKANELTYLASPDMEKQYLQVIPNPFTEDVQLKFKGEFSHLRIIDQFGNTKLEKTGPLGSGVLLSLSSLSAGVYILELRNNDQVLQTKIVKL